MRPLPRTTHVLAERHEALWLRFTSLHKDIASLAAKKPDAVVGEAERIVVEGLMVEARPFLAERKGYLPVAAPLLAGLAVQLGQVLAQLETYETRHTAWDAGLGLRCWRVSGPALPIGRLRQVGAPAAAANASDTNIRDKFLKQMKNHMRFVFQEGFRQGQAARFGPPSDVIAEPDWLTEGYETYPPLVEED